jgi:hypothetical protein
VNQSNNGESVSEPHRHKPKRHNAKLCPFPTRQQIVNALANGDSKRAISRAFRVSNNTVTAIAEQEWQQVAARKTRLAALAEHTAYLAGELILAQLETAKPGDIPLSVLNPVYSVAVEKAIMLRGDSALTLRHEHTLRITDDDILAFAVARSKAIEAQVIEESATSHLSTQEPDIAPRLP